MFNASNLGVPHIEKSRIEPSASTFDWDRPMMVKMIKVILLHDMGFKLWVAKKGFGKE